MLDQVNDKEQILACVADEALEPTTMKTKERVSEYLVKNELTKKAVSAYRQ